MKRLGPPSATVRFGKGLNSDPDPERLAAGELVTATRLRIDRGVAYKDRGSVQYGANTDALIASDYAQGLGYHQHPTDPRLLIAAGGDIKLDSDGSGTAWTDLATGRDAEADTFFAGLSGVTYIANGIDPTVRFKGGTGLTELPDLPRPEDTPIDYKPEPAMVSIDRFETAANYTGSGMTVTNEDSIKLWDARSMKCVCAGLAAGEKATRDLGANGVLDLSISDYVSFWINADTAGDWLVFEMSEDNSSWITVNVSIDSDKKNEWVMVLWDLKSIPQSARNAIRYLRFRTTKATAATFYVDQLIHSGGCSGEYTYAISFYDSETGNEGPIGCFRTVRTNEYFDPAQSIPMRSFFIPSTTVYMPVGADRIRLYRTITGGGSFYHVADITPVSNAWWYTDTTVDNDLGEDDVLEAWPGQCPRAQWLAPIGDRLGHIGGLMVVARNEADNGTEAQISILYSRVFQIGPFGRAPVYGVQFRTGTVGGTATITATLQRMPKGGSTTTDVAQGSLAATFATNTWYTIPLTALSYGDMEVSEDYDYRIKLDRTGGTDPVRSRLTWTPSGEGTTKVLFRLLCRADNCIFLSNLGDGGAIPPLGQEDQEATEVTGGFFTVGAHDGQEIRGWCQHGSDLLIFKDACTYLLTGKSMDDVECSLLLPGYGCREHRTAVDCDGYAVWMAQDKQIYAFRADTGIKMLSKEIEHFLGELSDAELVGANATYSDRRYWLFLPNAPEGSRCRIYDFDEEAWEPAYDEPVWAAQPFGDDPSVRQIHALTSGSTYYQVTKLDYGESDGGTTDCTMESVNRGNMAIPNNPEAHSAEEVGVEPGDIIRWTGTRGGVSTGTNYYVLQVAETRAPGVYGFTFSTTPGGSPFNIEPSGGTNAFVKHLKWKVQSRFDRFLEFDDDPAAVKRLRAYRVWHEGTEGDTLTVKFYTDRKTTAARTFTDTIPAVTGGATVRAVTRFPNADVVGESLSVEVGGQHITETGVHSVDLWLQRVR